MLILEAGYIKKYYNDKLIFGFDEMKVYTGDKIGVVGQNGSGKTTLLNILSGELEPDAGYVKRYCETAYIRQFSEEAMAAVSKLAKELNLTEQRRFSGGEKTRIKIANALSREGLLLFADEPTSNLDYQGIELLKEKLSRVGSFFLISHDRFLLDSLCNRIIEVRNGKVNCYNGNFVFYKEQSNMEYETARRDHENYMAEKESLEAALRNRQARAKTVKKAPKRMGNSEARLYRRRANEMQEKIHNAANSIKTRLEKLDVKERPQKLPKIKLDFTLTDPPENRIVIAGSNITFGYGNRRIFSNAGFLVYNGFKTALWGPNGSGKTTLLNLIGRDGDAAIHVVPKARIGYFYQGFENLDPRRSVLENVMKGSIQTETVARTILARLLIAGDNVHKKVEMLSGGEKIKVSFAQLFVSNSNVLLLDEPTNYLDMPSIEALESVLGEYEGTVLFVSHDKAFINAVADRLLIIEDQKIVEFAGNLNDYEVCKRKTASDEEDAEKMLLEMRIAEVVAKLSQPGADKESLEAEYQALVTQLSQAKMRVRELES